MMIDDDNEGQMIFGDLGGLKLPDICLTGEEKPRKNLTQKTCPNLGSNPGPLRRGTTFMYLQYSIPPYLSPFAKCFEGVVHHQHVYIC